MKTLAQILEMEKVVGGKADNMDPSQFNLKQLAKGICVEFEHTNNLKTAMEVAMDHLVEDPDYYQKLAKIHKEK